MSRWKARSTIVGGSKTTKTRIPRSFVSSVNAHRVPGQSYTCDLTYQFDGAALLSNAGQDGIVELGNASAAQVSAMQAIFSRYQINSVTYTFIPLFGTFEYNTAVRNGVLATNFGGQPQLYYMARRDDQTAPTSIASAMANPNIRIYTLGPKPLSITEVAPTFEGVVRDAGGTNGDKYETGKLDIDITDVQHYAGMWYVYAEGGGNPAYDVYVRMNVTFSDPR